jgi:peroxiredoxin
MKWPLILVAMIALAVNPCIAADLPALGDPPPALALPSLDGKLIDISQYYGKPLIVTFFATWSKSCQDEIKALQGLKDQYGSTLEVVAISFDKKSKTLSDFVEANKLKLNFLVDKKLLSLNQYAILIIPTTFCINPAGKIDKILVDYDDNVKQALFDWLK